MGEYLSEQEITQLYIDGLTILEIANKYHYTKKKVSQILHAQKLLCERRPFKDQLWTEKEEKRILQVWKQTGSSKEKIEQLQKELGRSWPSIYNRGIRLGLIQKKLQQSRPIGEFTETDKAYVAGFLDGEGSISINRRIEKNGHIGFIPRLSFTNTNKDVLLHIQKLIGFGYLQTRHRPSQTSWATCYDLVFMGIRSVRPIIQILSPYLIVKRKQADIVAEYCSNRVGKRRRRNKEDMELVSRCQLLNIRKTTNRRALQKANVAVMAAEQQKQNCEWMSSKAG